MFERQRNEPGAESPRSAECLWAQLTYERQTAERLGSNYSGLKYLENLEVDWARRDLCSRCLKELDHPHMIDVEALRRVE